MQKMSKYTNVAVNLFDAFYYTSIKKNYYISCKLVHCLPSQRI